VDSGQFNSNIAVKTYLRACWWPKPAAKHKSEEEMTADDYIYWFPERLTYEWLMNEKVDPIGFAIKFLNNPRKINKIRFPRDLLVRKTLDSGQMPQNGVIVTAVDTAYSTQPWADYTVIMTAIIWGGKFYVVNMVRGRFNEYDLPVMVAQTINLWKPKRVSIEESVGVKWFGRELKREMDKLQISVPITYASLGQGGKATSKAMKAKPVLRLMGDGRMYFSNSCAGLEEIKKELSQFTGTKDDTHDDIVSAVSLLVQEFGSYAECEGRDTVTRAQYAFVADEKSRDMYDRLYAMGRYAGNAPQDDNPRTQYQTENVQLGADQEVDPLADLF
jgi:phage terminase large subunit-like protein